MKQPTNRQTNVSLKKLSQIVGVSQTTVSRALNGYDDVNKETRERIIQAARAHGYAPNPLARRLAVGATETIGFVVPAIDGGFANQFVGDFLTGVAVGLGRTKYDLIVTAAPDEAGEMNIYERFTENQRVDAWILTCVKHNDERIKYLQKRNFPFVAFGRTHTDHPYAYLDIDNEAGARKIMQRLVNLGHRRIAFLDSPPEFNFAYFRHQGYQQALKEASIPYDPELCFQGDLTEENAAKMCDQFLDLSDPPTAFLCMSFMAYRGIAYIAERRGLTIGGDLSVITFDDTTWGELEKQKLTRLTQPMAKCGERTAEMLTGLLSGQPIEKLTELWEPVFIEGTTDRPCCK